MCLSIEDAQALEIESISEELYKELLFEISSARDARQIAVDYRAA
jgi:hypothetical protein